MNEAEKRKYVLKMCVNSTVNINDRNFKLRYFPCFGLMISNKFDVAPMEIEVSLDISTNLTKVAGAIHIIKNNILWSDLTA